jgi:hypothetical protein
MGLTQIRVPGQITLRYLEFDKDELFLKQQYAL